MGRRFWSWWGELGELRDHSVKLAQENTRLRRQLEDQRRQIAFYRDRNRELEQWLATLRDIARLPEAGT